MDNNLLVWVLVICIIFLVVILPNLLGKWIDSIFKTAEEKLFNKSKYKDGKLVVFTPLTFETWLSIPKLINLFKNNLNIKDDISNFQASLYLLDQKKNGLSFAYWSTMKPIILAAQIIFTDNNSTTKWVFSFTNYLESGGIVLNQNIAEKIYKEIQSTVSNINDCKDEKDNNNTNKSLNCSIDNPSSIESWEELKRDNLESKEQSPEIEEKSDFLNKFWMILNDKFIYYNKKWLWSSGYKKEISLKDITLVRFRMIRDINAIKLIPFWVALIIAGSTNFAGADLIFIIWISLTALWINYIWGVPTIEVITEKNNSDFFMNGWPWEKNNAEYLVKLLRDKIDENNKIIKKSWKEEKINEDNSIKNINNLSTTVRTNSYNDNQINNSFDSEMEHLEKKKRNYKIISTFFYTIVFIKMFIIGFLPKEIPLYIWIWLVWGVFSYLYSKIKLDWFDYNTEKWQKQNWENVKYTSSSTEIISDSKFRNNTKKEFLFNQIPKISEEDRKKIRKKVVIVGSIILWLFVIYSSKQAIYSLFESDNNQDINEQYTNNTEDLSNNNQQQTSDNSVNSNEWTGWITQNSLSIDEQAQEFLVNHYNDIASHNFEQAYSHFDTTNFTINNKNIIVNWTKIEENKYLANASLVKFSDLWKNVSGITVTNFTKISDLIYSYDTTITYNNWGNTDIYTTNPMKLFYQDWIFSITEYSATIKKDIPVINNLNGKYKVISDKTYFSDVVNWPKREWYLISWQRVDVLKIEGSYGYVEYENDIGIISKWWLELSTLKKTN